MEARKFKVPELHFSSYPEVTDLQIDGIKSDNLPQNTEEDKPRQATPKISPNEVMPNKPTPKAKPDEKSRWMDDELSQIDHQRLLRDEYAKRMQK